jgi:hypothetical protein
VATGRRINNFDGPPLGMMCFQTPFLFDCLS